MEYVKTMKSLNLDFNDLKFTPIYRGCNDNTTIISIPKYQILAFLDDLKDDTYLIAECSNGQIILTYKNETEYDVYFNIEKIKII